MQLMKHGMTSESLSTSLGARDDHPLPWTRDGCLTAGGRNQRHKKSPPAIGEHRRRKTRTFLVNHVGSTYETITDMWQLGYPVQATVLYVSALFVWTVGAGVRGP